MALPDSFENRRWRAGSKVRTRKRMVTIKKNSKDEDSQGKVVMLVRTQGLSGKLRRPVIGFPGHALIETIAAKHLDGIEVHERNASALIYEAA
jgi:hypothetical protein